MILYQIVFLEFKIGNLFNTRQFILIVETRGTQERLHQQAKEDRREDQDEESSERGSDELRSYETGGQSSPGAGSLQERLRVRRRSVLQGPKSRGGLSAQAEYRGAN